jgi:hypothetical protein
MQNVKILLVLVKEGKDVGKLCYLGLLSPDLPGIRTLVLQVRFVDLATSELASPGCLLDM